MKSKHSPVRVLDPITMEVVREIPILDNPRAIHKLKDQEAIDFLMKRRLAKKDLKKMSNLEGVSDV